MNRQQGFTLLEIILFIVISGIILSGLFVSFNTVLFSAAQPRQLFVAENAAEQRLDLILGQKVQNGYGNFVDPCNLAPGNSECSFYTNPPHNCVINVTNTPLGTPTYGSLISVVVSACGQARLTTFVGNY